jgi:hypothetical protein
MIWLSFTVSENVSGYRVNHPGAMILIKKGEKRMPNKVRVNKTTPAMVKAIWVSSLVSSSDLRVIYSVYTGMKEMVKDPSPTKRLHRLGILKATKKASAAIPVPKKLAMTISLKKPRIRLRKVPIPMMEAAFVILLCSDIKEIFVLPSSSLVFSPLPTGRQAKGREWVRGRRLDTRYNKMLKKSIT